MALEFYEHCEIYFFLNQISSHISRKAQENGRRKDGKASGGGRKGAG